MSALDMLPREACSIRIWGGYFTSRLMGAWTSSSDMTLTAIQVVYPVAILNVDSPFTFVPSGSNTAQILRYGGAIFE